MSPVKPKKYLGQHFLRDQNIALKIVQALDITDLDRIVEVGPGTGILTQHLIHEPHFVGYEVDEESIAYLNTTYPEHSGKVRHQDFLTAGLSSEGRRIGIIGNFPYNISSQIFFKILDHKTCVDTVVCMLQREVADRIVSKEGHKTYGILSVFLQVYYDVEYLFMVKPGAFVPPPKVNSAVIRLKRNELETLPCDEALFRRVVKAGFGKRRKTLRNALKELNLPSELTQAKIFSLRAEQLTIRDFISLTKMISQAWKA